MNDILALFLVAIWIGPWLACLLIALWAPFEAAGRMEW